MLYCSTYLNGEIDFLKLQFEVNYDYVDKFIITEGNLTYSGLPKDMYFIKHKHLFEKYLDKIIYIEVDIMTYKPLINPYKWMVDIESWGREKKQRDQFLDVIDFKKNDTVICVDTDEIIFLNRCKHQIIPNQVNKFSLDHRKYYFNSKLRTSIPWTHAIAYNPILYRKHVDNAAYSRFIENVDGGCNMIENAGYHFSWCIPVEDKLKSFSHQESNTPDGIISHKLGAKNLENCDIVNDLPEFLYKNYSKYIYTNN